MDMRFSVNNLKLIYFFRHFSSLLVPWWLKQRKKLFQFHFGNRESHTCCIEPQWAAYRDDDYQEISSSYIAQLQVRGRNSNFNSNYQYMYFIITSLSVYNLESLQLLTTQLKFIVVLHKSAIFPDSHPLLQQWAYREWRCKTTVVMYLPACFGRFHPTCAFFFYPLVTLLLTQWNKNRVFVMIKY